ncbi:hypothetical protein SK128_012886 [Halocaridina rubra]|uniref:Uncharacterized protein n=1 Tax=Halocaridina rubra TaxID=373956 RepID=A0AAN9A1A8_HALRR
MACENYCRKEDPNISPHSQGTEQDSDSVWSTASEDRSDLDVDPTSTDSVSHEIVTVRGKDGEETCDVQQLISAAESLALERVRQNFSRPNSAESTSGQRSDGVSSYSNDDSKERSKSVNSLESPVASQQSFETSDSGYSSKSNIHREVQTSTTLSSSESDQSTENQCLPKFCSPDSSCQGGVTAPTSHHNPSYDKEPTSQKLCDGSVNNIPKLSIDQVVNVQTTSLPDERIIVTKETKEVCNSSIRDFHETTDDHRSVNKLSEGVSFVPHSRVHMKNNSTGAKKVSLLVHDECSDILRLALTSTSSFGRVLRLLRQVMTLQFGNETPRVAESVKKELDEYEAQHTCLEGQLGSRAAHLQTTLSQVQSLESIYSELENDKVAINEVSLQILLQLEQALSAYGLQHMISITSPRRRNLARNLEDAETALLLILGELAKKTDRCSNLESEASCLEIKLEDLRKTVALKDERLLAMRNELEYLKEWSDSEINSLKYCLAQAEENLSETRVERDHVKDVHKRKEEDDKSLIWRLQKQLSDIQQSSDSRLSQVENSLQDILKEKLHAESTLEEAQQKLSVQEQQMVLINEEHKLLVSSLRSTIKHQQMEVERVQVQLEQILAEKQNLSKRAVDISAELSKEQEGHERLRHEASILRETLRDMKQEFADCERNLHDKIDKVSEIRCDLESQIRSRDLTILQLHTELQLDGQRISTLTQDNESLLQKVHSLQERIWDLTRQKRHSSNNSGRSGESTLGSCASLYPGTLIGSLSDRKYQELVKNVSDGQSREEQLHKLLSEKDKTIHDLQTSFASELGVKNKELEMLKGKLTELEEQMESLLSGLQVSAAIGSVTTEVGLLLQERTEHLENLNKSSHIIQDEYVTLAMDNQKLKRELSSAKQNLEDMSNEIFESTRRAKEEAREERLNAARAIEKCSKLQAELDFTKAVLEQERQERQMKDLIQQFKHENFEAVLNTSSSVND